MELKIEYLPITELKPYANNAKLHPAEQVEQIKKSIEQFGMNDPIAVWQNNEIIEGHGRLIAATELGLEVVPVVRLDDLTDEQRRAYALVHNKLTMNSGFDVELLAEELDSIQFVDMADYGFPTNESVRKDLDEFFFGQDEKNAPEEKNRVRFIITANEEQKVLLYEFLNDRGIDYEEI